MIILHISDLHIEDVIENKENKISNIAQILNKKYPSEEYVLILFSGDISQSGSDTEYQYATSFINDLTDCINKTKKTRIAICPGNHDRCFKEKEIRDESYIKGISKTTFNEEIERNQYLLENYYAFEKKMVPNFKQINPILKSIDFHIDDLNVRVYSLNNALLSSYTPGGKKRDLDKGDTFIRDQFIEVSRENNDYVFVITHMPISYFRDNTLAYLKSRFSSNVDICFTGHTHKEQIESTTNEDYEILECTSSAIDSKGMSGFSLLEINDDRITCSYFSFNSEEYVLKLKTEKTIQRHFSTAFGQFINEDKIKELRYMEIFDGEKTLIIPINKLFVFPQLSLKKYNNQETIKSFDNFEQKRSNNGVTKILGDAHSGKTQLLSYLFEMYRKKGFLPVICKGEELGTNFERSISKQLKSLYSNKNTIEDFKSVSKDKRILLIDKLEVGSRILFREALQYFGSIIYTALSSKDFVTSEEEDDSYQFETFEIESFYYDKRAVLYQKVYSYIEETNPSIIEDIDLNSFVKEMEDKLKLLDFDGAADPLNLIYFSITYLKKRSLSLESSNSLFQAKLFTSISQALKKGNYSQCDVNIAEDIISRVAMKAYEQQISVLTIKMFEEAQEEREKEYGNRNGRPPIKNMNSFVELLVQINVLKKDERSGLSFFNRKVFAHYVAKYAIVMKHSEDNDTYLKNIIQNGIYKPINLQILFSIATNYEYRSIPRFFANELYDSVMKEPEMEYDNFNNFFDELNKSDDEFKQLELSKELRNQVREKQGKQEERSRKRYLTHKDDYFYYDCSKRKIMKLDELLNKTFMISSLLNNFATRLKAADRSKLIEMLIKLPYAIINVFLSEVIEKLDLMFVRAYDQLSKIPEIKVNYEYVKQSIIDEIRASILTIFDLGTRLLRNPYIIEDIKNALESSGDKMHLIQKMMLLSFAPNRQLFITETKEHIKNPDIFVSSSVRLIGRRFCLDNYEWVEKNEGGFFQIITKGKTADMNDLREKSKLKK